MSKFTLYRADIDSPRLKRVLGKVPGVAVAGEQAGDEVPDQPTEETEPTADEDDGGLRERIPVPDTGDEDGKSVVKTYGLLGLGVSMVMLGIATVGIWVYRRRKGDDGESETPPPSTGLSTGVTARSPTEPETTETELSTTGTETTTSDISIVRPDEEAEDEQVADEPADAPEPHGRTEGDRSNVEWTARDTTPTAEPAAGESDESALGKAESDADEDEPRPAESVDAAPLLGAAFLAVTGAVVKWLQADADEP